MLTYDALPDERQQHIRSLLATHGKVIATELSEKFGVSEHTIRRDLADLARAGACRKVYGGAVALAPDGGTLQHRSAQQPERKQALAAAAISLLDRRQSLFLDAGSTNLAIARALPADLALTVVTNAPAIAAALIEREGLSIIMLGGQVDRAVGGAVGATAVDAVRRLSFDLAFLGACAIDPQEGLTAFDLEDAAFKRAVITRSGATAVAAVKEKLLSVATHNAAPIDEITTLIVEHDTPAKPQRAFEKAGVQLVLAGR
ncbi:MULTISPECIES: DeoR/GlpR family DNA-binding transcription regulator [Burkholderia]|uniref:DeoR/GlpR family DNA-binding transcription regulator n=1 Tax=Burkholderia TaxID=32008 RepID=UPI0004A7D844|nr:MULTISPECIES: DeoR/GlpR family DNA-binding transcription regulator [Burkholderia]NBI44354.1 DeoR/GlpR transcriptional regulator [Burkholderia sp. ISTR5]NIE88979.1 DeoR/GlpR transcriptional regulator [Burkholderia sp. Tr-860]NIF68259.1 DeoR/GlpR transcriptional regulator [Burkholderia sp. Cy-647]NIF72654.1 DeoR/GlpR transcriptional regulator [Burkholderia sp. Ap-962]NIF87289.1 DeoR/GlpR transcriptional regulator [Burkholderia sp. Cy-637]